MKESTFGGRLRLPVTVALAGALVLPAVASAGGKVTGKATFEGTPPARTKLAMDADPVCAAAHSEAAMSEEVIVNDGALQNVFVYVKDVQGDFPAKTEPATIDQKGCQYIPHVLGVQVGQPLQILNDDQTLHNVHSMPKDNPGFNFAMPKFVKKKDTKFEKPEVMVHVKCDVHPWMSGYVGVLPHPFFAVTAADGTFSIDGLPPGEYTVEAWHEKFGTQEGKVKVDEGGTATSDFTFKAS